jgi:hypothetical protein
MLMIKNVRKCKIILWTLFLIILWKQKYNWNIIWRLEKRKGKNRHLSLAEPAQPARKQAKPVASLLLP